MITFYHSVNIIKTIMSGLIENEDCSDLESADLYKQFYIEKKSV